MCIFNRIMIAVALCVGATTLASCESEAPAQQGGPPPIFASAVTVQSREVPVTYEYGGRIAPVKETQVRARVGGILLRRNFIEGARVNEGDVLFEIDPATYEVEVARQNALVAQAQANYQQAVRDADRAEQLLKQKVMSTAQRDQAVAIRDASAATLQQTQAALKMAELNLDYTRVTAPISGITSREAVSEGSLISINGLLTTITQNDPVYVNFSYSDSEAREIARLMEEMRARGEAVDHLSVRIRFGDGVEYGKLGVIDFTSPTLDAQTGTIGVRASVDNAAHQLVPGQFVRVSVIGLKLDNAMVIPEKALMQDSSGTFVYVVGKEGEIEKRLVHVKRQTENRDWILEPVETVTVEVAPILTLASSDSGAPPAAAPGSAPINAPQESLLQTHLVGLQEGERVITEGHFRIQAALRQIPPGISLRVVVTTLDGQDLVSPDQEGQGQPQVARRIGNQAADMLAGADETEVEGQTQMSVGSQTQNPAD